MKKSLFTIIAVLFLATAARADILIGVSMPVTGSAASLGEQAIAGIKAAVDDVNAKGGIRGEKVTLKIEDDACDPKQAVSAVNRLIAANVALIIGPACSGAFMAASDVTADENMPHVSPIASNPQITERGLRNLVRPYGRDDAQADILSAYIGKRFAGKKIAVIHDKSTWGKGLAEGVKDRLNKAGIKEVLFDSISQGEKDFTSLITKFKSQSIDVALLATFPVEAALIVRQSADMKISMNFIGGDAALLKEFWSVADKAANGFVMSGPLDPRMEPEAAQTIKSLQARNVNPELFTLYGYSGAQIALESIYRAGDVDRQKIISALRAGGYKTILGKIDFDDKGDLKTPFFKLYEWRDGDYVMLEGKM